MTFIGTTTSPEASAERVMQAEDLRERVMPAGEIRLVNADDLAARWGVPKSQVYRLTREGHIPVVRLGKYCRYRLDAIEAWERGDTTQHNAESVASTVAPV
jgi:excisionase family DNA binding protein